MKSPQNRASSRDTAKLSNLYVDEGCGGFESPRPFHIAFAVNLSLVVWSPRKLKKSHGSIRVSDGKGFTLANKVVIVY